TGSRVDIDLLERLRDRCLDRSKWMLARPSEAHGPRIAPRQDAAPDGGDQSSPDGRGLPAARWSDDAEEPGPSEPRDEIGDEPLAAVEQIGVRRLERREPLEWRGRRIDVRATRALVQARALADHLQVDDGVGDLGLDVAQAAPLARGARRRVTQPPARFRVRPFAHLSMDPTRHSAARLEQRGRKVRRRATEVQRRDLTDLGDLERCRPDDGVTEAVDDLAL